MPVLKLVIPLAMSAEYKLTHPKSTPTAKPSQFNHSQSILEHFLILEEIEIFEINPQKTFVVLAPGQTVPCDQFSLSSVTAMSFECPKQPKIFIDS